MSAAARIAAFGALLAVIFVAAALAGSTIDPEVETDGHMKEGNGEVDQHESNVEKTAEQGSIHGTETALPGLAVAVAVAEGGYRLIPERTTLPSGPQSAAGSHNEAAH